MANDDQVIDLYYRRIDSARSQDACRDRIHWLCSRVAGDRVLDIGCSQGISPIILGREGRYVLGVDIEESAIERARQELAGEPAHVQERVELVAADAFTIELPPAEFDAVILGEVLEHLAAPEKLLERVVGWLKPGGRVLVSVPFGYHPYHDHKRSYYLAGLLDLLGAHFSVVEVEPLHDLYLCAVGERPPDGTAPRATSSATLRGWHALCDQALERFERGLWQQRQQARTKLREQIPALRTRFAEARQRLRVLSAEKDTLARRLAAVDCEPTFWREQLLAAQDTARRAEDARERLWAELEKAQIAVRAAEQKTGERDAALRRTEARLQAVTADARQWKAECQRWRGAERTARQQLGARLARLQKQVQFYEAELERRSHEVRYRLGDAFVRAARPSRDTLLLPFRLWSLLLDGLRRRWRRRLETPAAPTSPAEAPAAAPYTGVQTGVVKQASQAMARRDPLDGAERGTPPAPAPTLRFPKFQPVKTPSRCGVKAATILDTFSHACFSYEMDLIPVTKANWRAEIEHGRPDFFFAESAWHGNNDEWEGLLAQFAAADNPLCDLLRWCRERQLPTVFWNKEDPPNYEHFIAVAREFDYVFTTDADCIPRYRRDLGHERVFALPFAAQPVIHNPLGADQLRRYDLCFAGSWHLHKHPERRRHMEVVLEPALALGLHIFDRCARMQNNQQRRFPDHYQPHIRGSLEYDEMLSAYRAYRVFLNVNSVSESPTMFARRVFELLACGTAVVSSESAGLRALFGNLVPIGRTPEETRQHLQGLLGDETYRQRLAHLGYRKAMTGHTYRDRLRTILDTIGLRSAAMGDERVGVVALCRTRAQVEAVLAAAQAQSYAARELHLLLVGDAATDAELASRLSTVPGCHAHPAAGDRPVGALLQEVIEAAGVPLVAWFDADCHYGRDFLTDMVLPFRFTDARIVGKRTHYRYRPRTDTTVLGRPGAEHVFTDDLAPGSLLLRAEMLRTLPLPDGADRAAVAAWLRQAASRGIQLYSADRFNFIAAFPADDGDPPDDLSFDGGGEQLVGTGLCVDIATLGDDPGQPRVLPVPTALGLPAGAEAAVVAAPHGTGPLRHGALGGGHTGGGGLLFYCVNGGGLGHLTRSLAIARRVRRHDPTIPVYFLTSSQALQVIAREGFVVYHIPPHSAYDGQVSTIGWNALLQEQIRLIVDTHRPTMLVYDGVFPYRGLLDALQECRFAYAAMVLRLRHKHDRLTEVADKLGLFNELIYPGEAGVTGDAAGLIPPELSRLSGRLVDPIVYLDRDELLPRDEVRATWAVPPEKKLVYVQLGAGNINDTQSWTRRTLDLLSRRDDVAVVLAESPIAARACEQHADVHILRHYPNALYFNGFDLAITAAGYNSFHEQLYFGVPSVLIPNPDTRTDDQVGRAMTAHQARAAITVLQPKQLEQAIGLALDEETAATMRHRALELVPRNGAQTVAEMLVAAAHATDLDQPPVETRGRAPGPRFSVPS